MSSVQNTRSSFFPNSRTQNERAQDVQKQSPIKRNSTAQKAYIDNQTSRDAKVTIPEAVKDFAQIKKAVDAAPEMDNSAKIAALKAQIQGGTYKMDYEKMADKILGEEFGV
ncbi:flagellar biosynthesis anti-sigma factor FlgM [Halobacteriovorax sp. BALOs_7]|uniref:Negative regulator of flagellin synthesis n=1 Tax=Halobacteriovorax vibrionivorans TaxID=2152716 RepID=A0ABY0IKF2_9BACT|nr:MULTISPECIES: flagellar biosynthesis anti-sigma factor FlgM [Halobacteriovorax]AYF45937.1 flagellar biosynthesis anti-sigma factor FlgM [Halobacteriovorax sp. BALOs_7]RZF22970.1 flagellar biosynthesis anti-sigma factor FlgM [Halobacteriovorax vibrionivorans]TGD46887.1 flagellar biosynthesis anti-sigma factor FlgM [Halobacteriovorax sp. Y22]